MNHPYNAASYDDREQRDMERLEYARMAIAERNYNHARRALDQIEVATYRRDLLRATIPEETPHGH